MEDVDDLEAAIAASLATHRTEEMNRQSAILARNLSALEDPGYYDEDADGLAAAHQEVLTDSYKTHTAHTLNRRMNECATEYAVERSSTVGCWDCGQCTLTNEPYTARCAACGTDAPSHVLVYSDLPPIRFGVEVEVLMPGGRRDGFTLESIARQLTALGDEAVTFEGYTHRTTDDWKIVTDRSLRCTPDDLAFELVSPVLLGSAGIAAFRNVMTNMTRLGIDTNNSCGLHVHVDAEDGSPLSNLRALKAVAGCFVLLEAAFDALVSSSSRRADRNEYCRSNRIVFGRASNRQVWEQIVRARSRHELVNMTNPRNDRYRKLNLTNITRTDRPSTVELRLHGGFASLAGAEAWIRLVLRFCRNAADVTSSCPLVDQASAKVAIDVLFGLVDCDGLEQAFTVDRRLFSDEEVMTTWDCPTCRKRFRSSQSLSQHCVAVGHRIR
ncbi:hypothetical protein THAOC_00470 [Thalassiosira oceanica]|uniref:RanBP2-type domain-containing protein n=1 Tax=Thalassiosira oceanica TaxID=159749 RepID=K3W4C2_THAOC|nr:hypothetical protein THAOC_00470 [Thalassiosira oceanica]|eukprot:EJK77684.1 hypothetical protein THAOC_00470 [Thalassiosira oceanica]